MNDDFAELRKQLLAALQTQQTDWKEHVYNGQSYQDEIKYHFSITQDLINTLRSISFYSTRAGQLYDDSLCIKATDDILQSAIAISLLVQQGIHNTVKRELRYLLELVTKYVVVDYAKMGCSLADKKQYLNNHIPRSSIEVVFDYSTPFTEPLATSFRSEVKDFYTKACAYVHPSKKQLDEQLCNYQNENTIGFESAAMFRDMNQLIFRGYDMILAMCFHAFGPSMSKDLFEQYFDEQPKWKFHKGKYLKTYRRPDH